MPSSSSSSIDSSSSSSSSSGDFNNRDVRSALVINNGHNNLIPFTFIAESGTSSDLGTDAEISFTIEGSSTPYFDYEAIIDMDNSALLSTGSTGSTGSTSPTDVTVYVPEDEKTKYKHEESFYIDIIAKDPSGIKSIRTHVEPNKYEFEDITNEDQTFYIPKFTWGK